MGIVVLATLRNEFLQISCHPPPPQKKTHFQICTPNKIRESPHPTLQPSPVRHPSQVICTTSLFQSVTKQKFLSIEISRQNLVQATPTTSSTFVTLNFELCTYTPHQVISNITHEDIRIHILVVPFLHSKLCLYQTLP